MALQSSGQIKLSEIATEFGGSAPHSLSEYYGSDTVPASGMIKLSDFYGTSDTVVLHSSNVTAGTYTAKQGQIVEKGYDRTGTTSGSNMGSITTTAISGTSRTVQKVMDRDDSATGAHYFEIRFNANFTGFTKIIINGSIEKTRASASVIGTSSEGYRWTGAHPVPTSFQIIQ